MSAHVLEQAELAGEEKSSQEKEAKEIQASRERAQKLLSELEEEEKSTHLAIQGAEFARKANESAKEELQSQLTNLKVREGKLDQETFSLEGDSSAFSRMSTTTRRSRNKTARCWPPFKPT